MSALSFENLNLRFNPFGELSSLERKQVAYVNIDGLAGYMADERTCIQFIADHGRGKTTHLLALHKQCEEFPFIRLHIDEVPKFEVADKYFIDSIENLSLFQRLKVYKKYKRLAVTTHRDLSWELRLSGFKVKTICVSTQSTQALLCIFQRRIEFARRNAGKVPELTVQQVDGLKLRYGDDIRSMEDELYEYFQNLREK